MNKLNNLIGLFKQAKIVKSKHGIAILLQFMELAKLRNIGIGIKDYYGYSLYSRSRFKSFDEKLTYRGWRFKDELRQFSPIRVQGLAFHKHILYRLLESFDLPSPKIFALYCAIPDGFERHRSMTSEEELKKYLKTTKDLPIFGKPSNASHGYGAIGINERANGGFVLADGENVTTAELTSRMHEISEITGTYMITEFLQPADYLRQICGSTLPSFRVVVLVRNGQPEFYKCASLLPQDKRHVSNFQGGQNKSIAAGIDPENGRLFQVINSDLEPTEKHPHSGFKLEGYILPEWQAAKDMIMTAALAFSPFRMQHWDLSFTSRGPVLLELNFIGDIEPLQHHGPPGLFTEQFRTFYETHKVE